MTKKPAVTFNMTGRGEVKAGYCADLCIFNPDTVIDKGTFVDPVQYPEGIEYVIIGGELTVENGKHTGKRNGAGTSEKRKRGNQINGKRNHFYRKCAKGGWALCAGSVIKREGLRVGAAWN